MPSIEITKEQAEALARGENVTLSPRSTEQHIALHKQSGTVYLTRGPLNDAEWRVIHKGKGTYTDKRTRSSYAEWDTSRGRQDFSGRFYSTMRAENA